MRRSRILQVHRDFAPDRGGGGVARHIHGLATIAARNGFDVRVVAPGAETPAAGADYDVRADAALGLWQHVGWADTVHVHGARNPIAAAAAGLARLRGKRIVYTPHCYYDDVASFKQVAKALWDKTVERQLLAGCDAVVFLAGFWLDLVRARGLAVKAPAIIPNCVLETGAKPRVAMPYELEGRPSLLYVGRLDRVKRLDDAIQALNEPGLGAAVLHLVGRGPDRVRLETLAARAGVAARVQFHGFVPDETVSAMAADASCFVFPSSTEGGPTVLIEMLLLGCRIVASDIPANLAILTEAGSLDGVYRVGDVSALARTVHRVVAQCLGPDEIERTRAAFTWERKAQQIVELYRGGSHDDHGRRVTAPEERQ
jgi:glycosyltransferase involved in cell wall biosynthesis